MATGGIQASAGYALGAQAKVKHRHTSVTSLKPARKIKMKLSIKQRIRNWLYEDESVVGNSMYVEEDRFSSDGIRLQVYKASGGYVVETRGYDRKNDRSRNSMHVIKDEDDLGDALGKIVMMEALQQ